MKDYNAIYLNKFKKRFKNLVEEKNFNYSIGTVRLNNINEELRTLNTLIDFLQDFVVRGE